MKPKTKIQIEVNALSHTLPKMSAKQKQYAFDTCFTEFFYKTKTHTTCMRCGHKWEDKTLQGSLLLSIGGVTCPKCKKELKSMQGKKRTLHQFNYIYLMTTIKNFQLLRYFHVTRSIKVGTKAAYSFMEVFQHWIREDGKHVVMSVNFNSFGYNEHWSGTELVIKQNKNDRFYIRANEIYPGKKLLRVIRRNGYKTSFHNLHPAWFFELILSEPKAETLLKAKQFDLFNNFNRYKERIVENWQSIRICIRNNYFIKDTTEWFNHLKLLKYFGKDLHSVKYICPTDLITEHNRLVEKKRRIDERIVLEKKKKQLAVENRSFRKAKAKFFDIDITNGEIRIVPLKSIEEFIKEGSALRHCVYTNEYYKKKDTLILSARKGNERLETIEVSLKEMEVVQSRGKFNKDSPFHKDIIDLVIGNIKTIRKVAQSKAARQECELI